MFYLNFLRSLVDQQQFTQLKIKARIYLDETGNRNGLPLLALGHAYLGEYQEALAVCDQVTAYLPDLDCDAQVDLAGVYCVLLRFDDAVPLLEKIIKSQPSHALALARLAWCRLYTGHLDEARGFYQRSAELASHRLPVWFSLVRLYLQEENPHAAKQALEAAQTHFEILYAKLPEEAKKLFTNQLHGLQLEIWVITGQIAEAEQWLDLQRENLDEEVWTGLIVGYSILLAGQDRCADAEAALRDGLKHCPENLAMIAQLAEFTQLQGRMQQTVRLLLQAIQVAKKQEKPEINLLVRLSSIWLHQTDDQARKAAEKAVELAEAMVESDETPLPMIRTLRHQAKNALATVESQAQHFELAESLFREILEENPWFLPTLQGLGQQQMQRGLINEAIALFKRSRQIDPVQGYVSLINARHFPEDVETLTQLEKNARQPSMEGSIRSGILLQLAVAWEKRQAYDKAFTLAEDANKANQKQLQYDPKAHRQRCARIRYAFCKSLYEHRQDCGVDSTLPVYVLGMPRSGTTLVEQVLAGHSQICGAGELGVIPQVIAGLERWERHTGSGRHYPDCVDDLNQEMVANIANKILKELQEHDPKAQYVIDKMPHNFENIGLIKFLFPKAKIISVRRDPRDIAISNYFTDYQAKHSGMGFAYDLTWIGEQLADHNLLMYHWQQLFPGEILEVNYEQIVEDTEGIARKMLNYIGVEWEPCVMNFNKLNRPVKTASVWQVRQPIYKTSNKRWLNYQSHLQPLIKGTNAKINSDPITMITLPQPGFLTDGVAFYRNNQLDEAEVSLKKMLHHNPDHAACNYMLGLVYLNKNHLEDGVAFIEKALKRTPWQKEWRDNLIKAYKMVGATDKLAELLGKHNTREDALFHQFGRLDSERELK